jgi:adenosylmethionine-8-amino-7-oxononanoate aminotransferase
LHLPRSGTSPNRGRADAVEQAILAEGPDTVAAFFVEPVQNSGGCFVPPPGYFERVREICDTYDVLLVSDEVICAYGRTGGSLPRRTSATCPTGPDLGILADRRRVGLRPGVRAVP